VDVLPDVDQASSVEPPMKLETKPSSKPTTLDEVLPMREAEGQNRMVNSFTSDGQLTSERQQALMEQASKRKRRR
jgi:hypothetical protein